MEVGYEIMYSNAKLHIGELKGLKSGTKHQKLFELSFIS
jgi:hypothetical protein